MEMSLHLRTSFPRQKNGGRSTAATLFNLGKERIRSVGVRPILHGFSQFGLSGKSEFGQEILQAGKPVSIAWSSMTIAMSSRSMRLLAVLKSSFQGHPRTSNLTCLHGRYSGEFRFAGSLKRTRS